MFMDPDDPDRLMLGTDGGLYISHDRAKTWLDVNTLPLAEFYAISIFAREPYKIWGGTQDNGVLGGEAKPMTPGLEHWHWDHGGDNYVTLIDANNLDTMYLEGIDGSMGRNDLKTGASRGIRARVDAGREETPIQLDDSLHPVALRLQDARRRRQRRFSRSRTEVPTSGHASAPTCRRIRARNGKETFPSEQSPTSPNPH